MDLVSTLVQTVALMKASSLMTKSKDLVFKSGASRMAMSTREHGSRINSTVLQSFNSKVAS